MHHQTPGQTAPLFEEKVVDHIVSIAKVTERKVSKEKLTKLDEDEKGVSIEVFSPNL